MLQHLHISNYALISRLDIDFSKGFSVITGETGAGKSIILGALGLLLGQRADAKAIKTGAQKCCVEATFDAGGLNLETFFSENDIDFDGHECIVRREVNTGGKSRAFINDTPVPVAVLKEAGSHLIDIHSQHQNLLLNHETFLLDTLDAVARDAKELDDYRHLYDDYRRAVAEWDELKAKAEQSRNDEEFLRFQLQRLDEADLHPGEQEELEEELETLSHAEEIKEALFRTSAPFSAEENSPLASLKAGCQSLRGIGHVFAPAEELSERLSSVCIELEDIAAELERQQECIEFNPERLAYVDARLGTIYDLEKKHHAAGIDELLQTQEELRDRLSTIENLDELLAAKEKTAGELLARLTRAGEALTAARKKAAAEIADSLTQQLQHLGMPAVRLSLQIDTKDRPEASGMDAVTFLFSANKNVALQNVAQIASGGEIARLMLSLKALISRCRHLPTIIFDEIDTGVSGTMAEKMANVMQQMACNCQVICITHLPQIAALGTTHYRVYKQEDETGTTSHIDRLTPDERIREIANMLSGAEMTEAAINNAKSLLKIH